mmetsp:Transcript_24684/g.28535  ORF Transcript_24684/g.28535 Transcript_24684/m.28535 type:complete len:200 (-) Transcript_24684:95-694(-)
MIFSSIRRTTSYLNLMLFLLSSSLVQAHGDTGGILDSKDEAKQKSSLLLTKLYKTKCDGSHYMHFITPIGKCYNGQNDIIDVIDDEHDDGWMASYLHRRHNSTIENTRIFNHTAFSFIHDVNPVGDQDIKDEIIVDTNHLKSSYLKRSFYRSVNRTCSGGVADSFDHLPLEMCIGPFGPPYPWGVFDLVEDTNYVFAFN